MTEIKNPTQGGQVSILTEDNLHEYQKRAVSHILKKSNCALWLDMGL